MENLSTPPGRHPMLSQNFRKRASILSVCVLTSAGVFLSPSVAFAAEIGFPVAPTANDACGTADDTASIEAAPGVTWYQVVDGTRVEVSPGVIPAGGLQAEFVAATAPGDNFPDGSTEQFYTLTYTDDPCTIMVHPNHPRFDDFAGTANDTVTIPFTEGVIYVMNGVAVAEGVYAGSGEVIVEATAAEGYQMDPAFQSVFTYTFDAGDVVAVSAIPPTFNDENGAANDTVTIPVKEGVQYFINSVAVGAGVYPAEGEVIVEAVAQEGYTLEPGSDAVFVHYFDSVFVGAVIVTPTEPTFIDESGTDGDAIVIPETEGVTYYLNGGLAIAGTYSATGSVTVEAVANEGYEIDPNSQSVFNYTFDTTVNAIVVTPASPAIQDNCGIENDGIIIEAQEGVDYYLVGVDANQLLTVGLNEGITGDVTVEAVAQEGYAFATDAQVSWNFSILDAECTVAAPAAPEFNDVSGVANDVVVIPETEGVNYSINGEIVVAGEYPGVGTMTVVATAAQGYNLDPAAQNTWEFVFDTDVIVTPEEPVFTDLNKTEWDTVTIPDVEGVDYFLDGEAVAAGEYPGLGTVVVEAVAQEGFEFSADATTEWTNTFSTISMVTPVYPFFDDAPGTADDMITIPAAEGMDYYLNGELVTNGDYPGVGTVTVEAVAQEGYQFPDGSVSEWTFTFSDAPDTRVSPIAPEFNDVAGTSNDTVTIRATAGVQYLLNGEEVAPGTYPGVGTATVVANPEEGVEFAPNAETVWTFEFEGDVVVTPQQPTINGNILTIPDTEGVQYFLNGEAVGPGTYTLTGAAVITAEALPGYELAEGTTLTWEVEPEAAPIEETPVDETPVTTPITPPVTTPIIVTETPNLAPPVGVITPQGTDFLVDDPYYVDDTYYGEDLADTGANPALFGLLGAGGLLTALGAGLARFGRNKKA